jgi:hypothetical protein
LAGCGDGSSANATLHDTCRESRFVGLAQALLEEEADALLRRALHSMKESRRSLPKRIVQRRLRGRGERTRLTVAVRVWQKKERSRP